MSISNTRTKAIQAIRDAGVLLVFPIDNRRDPDSIWYQLHPRTKMRWEWDDNGDHKVSDLWHLREELSRSNQVVYTKWYQGRATFFSRPVFAAMLRRLNPTFNTQTITSAGLSPTALTLLHELESDSPLSTKVLKLQTGLKGKLNESLYTRSLKELWLRLLIVGYGEVDEGAFPSLAIGATRVLFEELWNEAQEYSMEEAEKVVRAALPANSLFLKQFEKLTKPASPSRAQNSGARSGAEARRTPRETSRDP